MTLPTDIMNYWISYLNDTYRRVLAMTSHIFKEYSINSSLCFTDILRHTKKQNRRTIIQWALENGLEHLCNAAAACGFKSILKWANKYGDCNEDTYNIAIKNGHINILKWLDKEDCPKDDTIYCLAVKSGNFDVVDYFIKTTPNHYRIINSTTVRLAAESGNFKLFKWIFDNYLSITNYVLSEIAGTGNIECLKYAISSGKYSVNSSIYIDVAYNGHLEMLIWLHKNGYTWDIKSVMAAVDASHLHILKYLCHNSNLCNESIFARACIRNNFEIVKYLRTIGCPWSSKACCNAAMCGRLEILNYLHENNCPYDELLCIEANYQGRLQDYINSYLQLIHNEKRIDILNVYEKILLAATNL